MASPFLYFAYGNGWVKKVNANDDTLVSEKSIGSFAWGVDATRDASSVYTVDYGNEVIYGLNEDLSQKWSLTVSSVYDVAVDSNDKYVYANDGTSVLKLNTNDGSKTGTTYNLGETTYHVEMGPDGNIYVCGANGAFASFAPDGTENWKRNLSGNESIFEFSVNSTHVAVGDNAGGLFLLDKSDGTTLQSGNTGGGGSVRGVDIDSNSNVLIGEISNNVYLFDSTLSNVWTTTLGTGGSGVAFGESGAVYAGDRDGYLYELNKSDGTQNYKKQFGSGFPSGIHPVTYREAPLQVNQVTASQPAATGTMNSALAELPVEKLNASPIGAVAKSADTSLSALNTSSSQIQSTVIVNAAAIRFDAEQVSVSASMQSANAETIPVKEVSSSQFDASSKGLSNVKVTSVRQSADFTTVTSSVEDGSISSITLSSQNIEAAATPSTNTKVSPITPATQFLASSTENDVQAIQDLSNHAPFINYEYETGSYSDEWVVSVNRWIDGKEVTSFQISSSHRVDVVGVGEKGKRIFVRHNEKVSAFDMDGNILWNKADVGPEGTYVPEQSALYLSGEYDSNTVYKVDAKTGEQIASFSVSNTINDIRYVKDNTQPMLVLDVASDGSYDETIIGINANTLEKEYKELGDSIISFSTNDSFILTNEGESASNKFSLHDAKTGAIIADGFDGFPPVDNDSNVVLTDDHIIAGEHILKVVDGGDAYETDKFEIEDSSTLSGVVPSSSKRENYLIGLTDYGFERINIDTGDRVNLIADEDIEGILDEDTLSHSRTTEPIIWRVSSTQPSISTKSLNATPNFTLPSEQFTADSTVSDAQPTTVEFFATSSQFTATSQQNAGSSTFEDLFKVDAFLTEATSTVFNGISLDTLVAKQNDIDSVLKVGEIGEKTIVSPILSHDTEMFSPQLENKISSDRLDIQFDANNVQLFDFKISSTFDITATDMEADASFVSVDANKPQSTTSTRTSTITSPYQLLTDKAKFNEYGEIAEEFSESLFKHNAGDVSRGTSIIYYDTGDVSPDEQTIVAVSLATNTILWQNTLDLYDGYIEKIQAVDDGVVVWAANSLKNKIYKFDKDGNKDWQKVWDEKSVENVVVGEEIFVNLSSADTLTGQKYLLLSKNDGATIESSSASAVFNGSENVPENNAGGAYVGRDGLYHNSAESFDEYSSSQYKIDTNLNATDQGEPHPTESEIIGVSIENNAYHIDIDNNLKTFALGDNPVNINSQLSVPTVSEVLDGRNGIYASDGDIIHINKEGDVTWRNRYNEQLSIIKPPHPHFFPNFYIESANELEVNQYNVASLMSTPELSSVIPAQKILNFSASTEAEVSKASVEATDLFSSSTTKIGDTLDIAVADDLEITVETKSPGLNVAKGTLPVASAEMSNGDVFIFQQITSEKFTVSTDSVENFITAGTATLSRLNKQFGTVTSIIDRGGADTFTPTTSTSLSVLDDNIETEAITSSVQTKQESSTTDTDLVPEDYELDSVLTVVESRLESEIVNDVEVKSETVSVSVENTDSQSFRDDAFILEDTIRTRSEENTVITATTEANLSISVVRSYGDKTGFRSQG